MVKLFKNIVEKIIDTGNPLKEDIDKSSAYLYKFSEPKGCIERSFFQYKCQMYQCGFLRKILLNMGAIVLLPLFYIKLKNIVIDPIKNDNKAVFFSKGNSMDLLPKSLTDRFKDIEIVDLYNAAELDNDGRKIIKESLKKHPFSFYWVLKNLINLSIYCSLIKNGLCDTIIASSEYSFSSSILTQYCNSKGIKHINIMHGEKVFNIRDSFFYFNECYIWDAYYKELFINLRALSDTFFIENPFSFKNMDRCEDVIKVDYKYYLQKESVNELNKVHILMKQLNSLGYTTAIRPHPVYSNLNQIREVFNDIEIEDWDINIRHSILSARHVVSKYSTILFQAYSSGVNAIVDDVTDVELYENLKKIKYIMLYKNDGYISSVIEGRNEK